MKFQRPFLFQEILETVYNYNMNRDKDKDLGLTVRQGVAGLAYSDIEGKSYIVDLVNTKERFNLSDEQLKRTSGIKFIISTPILEWDAESGKLTDKTIGVVNIDSKKNEYNMIQKKIAYEDLIKHSYYVADFISMLY